MAWIIAGKGIKKAKKDPRVKKGRKKAVKTARKQYRKRKK